MPTAPDVGGIAADRLRSFVERVERIEEEIRALQENRKLVYSQAKSEGFDGRTLRAIIAERRLDEEERRERLALLQLYRAALGMLDGTPLGEAATRRLMGKARPEEENPGPPLPLPEAEEAPPQPPTEQDLLAARAQGAAAAKAGRPVLDNPFPAGDARRAAWDEGWCGAAGSDGMDIPAAFRRTKPKKGKGDGKPAGKGH